MYRFGSFCDCDSAGTWSTWTPADCESLPCGRDDNTQSRTFNVHAGKTLPYGCPPNETRACPMVECPADCVYNPGTDGNSEGWVDVECRDYNGTACDRNGSGQGRMYQTRTVKSEAIGSGTPCGVLHRNYGPGCLMTSCAPLDCEYHYVDATPTTCTPKESVCVFGHSNYQKGEKLQLRYIDEPENVTGSCDAPLTRQADCNLPSDFANRIGACIRTHGPLWVNAIPFQSQDVTRAIRRRTEKVYK